MENQYGSDFITITDEDGTEYELEVLTTLEYNGDSYMAVIPAGQEDAQLEVSILKSIEEDGELASGGVGADDARHGEERVGHLVLEEVIEVDDILAGLREEPDAVGG